MQFPDGFVWGAATAAAQVEGAAFEQGKGLSNWDVFAEWPGKVWRDQTPSVACDQYHRYQEDVGHMKTMGLQAYRLSTAWPRVMPEGTGAINEQGMDYYDRLVDELLAAEVTPYITLYHWDLPYELHLRGGWMNPDIPEFYAQYVTKVVERLSDRVNHWFTLNEPHCFIGLGYETGIHAPGMKRSVRELLQIYVNTLTAHGRGVQAIRAAARKNPEVSIAHTINNFFPATDSAEDIEAARRRTFNYQGYLSWVNAWWFDPMLAGHYPKDMPDEHRAMLPFDAEQKLETIHQPLDSVGLNLYAGVPVKAGDNGDPIELPWSDDTPFNRFDWPVTPQIMYWTPRFVYERYGIPMMITENGVSCAEWPSLDGRVHDAQRIDFTVRYLRELARAISEGIDVRGYFHWSFIDNFEWAEGYKHQLGLIYLNRATQERLWKDSAHWYQQTILANGRNLFASPEHEHISPPSPGE